MSHTPGPSARIRRGLQWVLNMARADFEAVWAEGNSTGQFSGTTRAEVSDALEWLAVIAKAEGKS